jgi:hypothetical protein
MGSQEWKERALVVIPRLPERVQHSPSLRRPLSASLFWPWLQSDCVDVAAFTVTHTHTHAAIARRVAVQWLDQGEEIVASCRAGEIRKKFLVDRVPKLLSFRLFGVFFLFFSSLARRTVLAREWVSKGEVAGGKGRDLGR